jgi:hypothetical protein
VLVDDWTYANLIAINPEIHRIWKPVHQSPPHIACDVRVTMRTMFDASAYGLDFAQKGCTSIRLLRFVPLMRGSYIASSGRGYKQSPIHRRSILRRTSTQRAATFVSASSSALRCSIISRRQRGTGIADASAASQSQTASTIASRSSGGSDNSSSNRTILFRL